MLEEIEKQQEQKSDSFLPHYIVFHIMTFLRRKVNKGQKKKEKKKHRLTSFPKPAK